MGNCIFWPCAHYSAKPSSSDYACVVHVNGFVQHFSCPVTVTQITGTPPTSLVLFTSAQLLSAAPPRPLLPEHPLQPGRVYFLLRDSVLYSGPSPAELASLVTMLMKAAKRARAVEPIPLDITSSAGGDDDQLIMMKGRRKGWQPLLETIRELSSASPVNPHEYVRINGDGFVN